MTTVFADTSYCVALLSSRDRCHTTAVDFTRNFTGRLVTTAWVLTELGNFLSRGRNRRIYAGFVADLLSDSRVDVTEPSMGLFREGLDLFLSRPDKEWSLTDCISIVVLQNRKLSDVLTADHHFEQAGFHCLLKS